jgi:hypothetical protein
MLERITLKENEKHYDAVITYEMDYDEGTRMLMSHLLWSTMVFLISLLV